MWTKNVIDVDMPTLVSSHLKVDIHIMKNQ